MLLYMANLIPPPVRSGTVTSALTRIATAALERKLHLTLGKAPLLSGTCTPTAGRSTWPAPPSAATSPTAAERPLVPNWSQSPRPFGTCGSSADAYEKSL